MYFGSNWLTGFKFFDKNNTLIFGVGDFFRRTMKAVEIDSNEQIIGFKANDHSKGTFNNFQLMLCKRK